MSLYVVREMKTDTQTPKLLMLTDRQDPCSYTHQMLA